MKLMEVVRDALRTAGYSFKTEQTYMGWIRRYARFHLPRHPRETGTEGVRAYITHLAVEKNYSPATQNQALAAILFMYRVLGVEIGDVSLIRAKKEAHLRTVLSEDEVMRVLEQMTGVYRIMAEII